ncbi:unnamed protein product, partial [Heterosigma akashiwo]
MMGADARYWPWRVQIPEKQAIYADYKNIQKPLPSPPPGQTWMKQENNEWVLVPCEVVQPASGSGVQETSSSDPTNEGTPTIEEDKRPTFLEHIILPSDTLTGICLRHRCKPAELRRLNNFFWGQLQVVPETDHSCERRCKSGTASAALGGGQGAGLLQREPPRAAGGS